MSDWDGWVTPVQAFDGRMDFVAKTQDVHGEPFDTQLTQLMLVAVFPPQASDAWFCHVFHGRQQIHLWEKLEVKKGQRVRLEAITGRNGTHGFLEVIG